MSVAFALLCEFADFRMIKPGGADGFSLAVRDVITFRLDSCTDRRAAKFRSMSEFHRLFLRDYFVCIEPIRLCHWPICDKNLHLHRNEQETLVVSYVHSAI